MSLVFTSFAVGILLLIIITLLVCVNKTTDQIVR